MTHRTVPHSPRCRKLRTISLLGALAIASAIGLPAALPKKIAFTISMPQRAARLTGELQDFTTPVWSPGYYGIGDYARNVSNLRVADGAGRQFPFEKISKNTWRVAVSHALGDCA